MNAAIHCLKYNCSGPTRDYHLFKTSVTHRYVIHPNVVQRWAKKYQDGKFSDVDTTQPQRKKQNKRPKRAAKIKIITVSNQL